MDKHILTREMTEEYIQTTIGHQNVTRSLSRTPTLNVQIQAGAMKLLYRFIHKQRIGLQTKVMQ